MSKPFAKSSLKHQVADAIRRMIFEGQLQQGEKLTETHLSDLLSVSRSSVREAILLLELEGLLTSEAYKETRVTTITQEEVLEVLLPLRSQIEAYALKKGFPNWSDEIKQQFKDIVEEMRKATTYDDLLAFIELDIELHGLIVQSCRLEHVMRIWESIVNRIRLHFLYQNSKSGTLEKWLVEHEDLVDVLVNGDCCDTAVKALKSHIRDTNLPAVYCMSQP